MADLTQGELLALARVASIPIPDEDIEPLTLRFNAMLEAMEELGRHPIEDVPALPSLPHPRQLPSTGRPTRSAPPLATETDAPLAYKPITELSHMIASRQISPVELTELYLQRIGEHDGALRSYITVTHRHRPARGGRSRGASHVRPALGAAARRTARLQGRVLHQRRPHHLWLADSLRVRARL